MIIAVFGTTERKTTLPQKTGGNHMKAKTLAGVTSSGVNPSIT
jgi:hypothetical protein